MHCATFRVDRTPRKCAPCARVRTPCVRAHRAPARMAAHAATDSAGRHAMARHNAISRSRACGRSRCAYADCVTRSASICHGDTTGACCPSSATVRVVSTSCSCWYRHQHWRVHRPGDAFHESSSSSSRSTSGPCISRPMRESRQARYVRAACIVLKWLSTHISGQQERAHGQCRSAGTTGSQARQRSRG